MNPDNGRMFLQPLNDQVKQQGLVPAPLANSSQVKRMKVMRNEPCPCGSGKKFKKCCMHKGLLV